MPPSKYSRLQNIIPARVKYETNFIFTVYKFHIALSRLNLQKSVKNGQKTNFGKATDLPLGTDLRLAVI
jgi:hypothetical protein